MIYTLIILLKLGGTNYKVQIFNNFNILEILDNTQIHPFKYILINKEKYEWFYVKEDFSYRTKINIPKESSFFETWIMNDKTYHSSRIINEHIIYNNQKGIKIEKIETLTKIEKENQFNIDEKEQLRKHILLCNVPIFNQYIPSIEEKRMSFLKVDNDLESQFSSFWIVKSELQLDDYNYTDYEITDFYELEITTELIEKIKKSLIVGMDTFLTSN